MKAWLRPHTLSARLAVEVGLAAAASVAAFALVAALVLYLDASPGSPPTQGEAPFDELVEHLAWATAVAAPLALLLSAASARWIARRAMARVDALVSLAADTTIHNIGTGPLRERVGADHETDEIGRLVQVLDALFARVHHGIEAHRQFAADASHELRTPLAVFINTLEVTRRHPRSAAEWETVADQTLAEARRMSELVDALLQAARDIGYPRTAHQVDLGVALSQTIQRWRAMVGEKVRVQGDLPAGLLLQADARALDLLFDNLLSNAVAHSPPGATVRVRAYRRATELRVEVEDEGPGLAPQEAERVFERFTRGESADHQHRDSPGFGLGLSIVKRVVEAGGGRVFVDEAYTLGARFVVALPAA